MRPGASVPITAPELERALQPFREISGSHCHLALPVSGPAVVEQDGALHVVLQLIVYEDFDGELQIRDIKEQRVRFVPAVARDDPERVLAWVQGWAAAVGEVLSSAPPGRLDGCLPRQLVDLGPLKLARTETAEQFRAALLKKSRLGRWLVA